MPPLLGIVGPTGSDKSALAMAVARLLPVEILVADSRQVHRGMDIGTAKPDHAARAAVPHHLLDLVDPDERFTVAQWVARARELIPEIGDRGRQPLLVGGAGLYVAALVEGHEYQAQGSDLAMRASLSDDLASSGLPSLVQRLDKISPAAAAHVDRTNSRRVIRALERASGGGVAPVAAAAYSGRVALIGLHRPREVLYRRIDERARWLFANGLLEEVSALLAKGYGPELRPMTGHGYAESMRHLAGEWTLEEAIEGTARRTRQYAKRQLTWFRNQARVTWLDAGHLPGDDPGVVASAIKLYERELERDRLP